MKTLAARILDQMKIAYELRAYYSSDSDFDAESVARKIGFPSEQVFKTLVARTNQRNIAVACVPANAELDLKAFARAIGEKSVDLVPVKEIQSLTGYVRGGVSPLGMKKRYPFYLDSSALDHKQISISAGQRGIQILIAPADLQKAAQAVIADIAKSGKEG